MLLSGALVVAAVLLDGRNLRRRALRTASKLSGRASTALHSASLSTGLAYVDLAYPYQEPPDGADQPIG